MSGLKGVVLHGGKGTRLRPLTHTGPKQLIPIGGKAISEYVLEDLRDAGITEVALVLGDIAPDQVREYYGDGSRLGMKITYVDQGPPLGIAHAVGLCKDFVKQDKFVVFLGDNLLKGGVSKYVNEFKQGRYDTMLLLTRTKHPEQSGVADFDPTGKLRRIVEKPKYPPSPYIVTGIYFFSPDLFDAIAGIKPSQRGELEITDALQSLLDSGKNVSYRFVEGWWKDTGTVEDILDANRLVMDDRLSESVLQGQVEEGATVEGRVFLEAGAVIKKGAVVRGPCHIGSETTIGPKTYVGPYTSVGRGCLLENLEIENSILMENCKLTGIKQRITDSIIGKTSDIRGSDARPGSARFIVGEGSQIAV